MEAYRVLFHMDERERAKTDLTFRDIEALLDDLGGGNATVEVVADGDGIYNLLREPGEYRDEIRHLRGQGVRFLACENTLSLDGLSRNDLLEMVETVPSGVGEIARREREGWQYIKP